MKPTTRKLFIVFILIMMTVLGVLGWRKLHEPSTLPIKVVKVQGQYQYVSADTLKQTLLPFVQAGFFNVNITAAQNAMLQIPGVAETSIRRVWPETVVISITEQQAFARWQLGGFLTASGMVFVPKQQDADKANQLPLFIGQVTDIPELFSMFQQYSQMLASQGLHITMLSIDSIGDWQLKTDKGFLMDLGSEDMLPRLQEFLTGYQALLASQPNAMLLYVDLRYRDGFAVKWSNSVSTKSKSIKRKSSH